MSMPNPTALLKIIAALTPIMGNKELGEAMAMEIRDMFASMKRSADAQEAIAAHLQRLHENHRDMIAMLINIQNFQGGPIPAPALAQLTNGAYLEQVSNAIALGEKPHDAAG